MKAYPIPVHCEAKSSIGVLGPYQKIQRDRIRRSGSIYIVVDNPEAFHQFFVDHGLDKLEMQGRLELGKARYKEAEVRSFIKSYLKMAEKLYGIYWENNVQGIGSTRGRPDIYFEIPRITEGK